MGSPILNFPISTAVAKQLQQHPARTKQPAAMFISFPQGKGAGWQAVYSPLHWLFHSIELEGTLLIQTKGSFLQLISCGAGSFSQTSFSDYASGVCVRACVRLVLCLCKH